MAETKKTIKPDRMYSCVPVSFLIVSIAQTSYYVNQTVAAGGYGKSLGCCFHEFIGSNKGGKQQHN